MPRRELPALRPALGASLALVLAAQLGLPAHAFAAPEGQEAPAPEAQSPASSEQPQDADPPVQKPSGEAEQPAAGSAEDVAAQPADDDASAVDSPPANKGEPPTEVAEPPAEAEQPIEAPASVPVEELEAQRPAPAPALDTDSELDLDTDEGFDDDFDPMRDTPEAMSARRLFGAGVGAMVTGAVLIGGAVALGTSDPCDPNAGNNCFDDARDRAAVTMGAPGGVLLVGGIVMTTIGALQKKRIRASVALGPEGGGVIVRGRF